VVSKHSKAIIVDLDGTLFNVDHRVHYMKQKPKDYESFEDEIVNDDLNMWCCNLVKLYDKAGYHIIIITGRHARAKEDTQNMLERYNVPYDKLYLREDPDKRPDEIVKREIYNNYLAHRYDVEFVVEDRTRVVKMWREIGLTCLQCAEGDF